MADRGSRRALRRSVVKASLMSALVLCAGPVSAAPLGIEGGLEGPFPLGAVPCSARDGIDIRDARVRPWEDVTCTSEQGAIFLEDVEVVPDGVLRAHGPDVVLTGDSQIRPGASVLLGGSEPAAPWGEEACVPGEDDCNPCVDGVVDQFLGLFDDAQYEEDTLYWEFELGGFYSPAQERALYALSSPRARTHVQGLVATNSEVHPLAGVYSRAENSRRGYAFFVDANGDLSLLFKTWSRHPSSASVLGEFLVFGDKNAELAGTGGYLLRLFPVATLTLLNAPFRGYLPLPNPEMHNPGPTMGGGATLARLRSGGMILITTGPGKSNEKPKFTDFFYLMRDPGVLGPLPLGSTRPDRRYAMSVEYLGRWYNDPSVENAAASWKYDSSQNLTSMVECGTGDVYVMHAGVWKDELTGPGTYRLSKVAWTGDGGPRLEPVAWGKVSTDAERCAVRASGTAWAAPDGSMEIYCSEYRATGLENRMHFTRRRVP